MTELEKKLSIVFGVVTVFLAVLTLVILNFKQVENLSAQTDQLSLLHTEDMQSAWLSREGRVCALTIREDTTEKDYMLLAESCWAASQVE